MIVLTIINGVVTLPTNNQNGGSIMRGITILEHLLTDEWKATKLLIVLTRLGLVIKPFNNGKGFYIAKK